MKQTENKRPIKHGLLAFILSFFSLLVILTIQYISNYNADIFGKYLDNATIIKVISFVVLSLMIHPLPISILVMTTVYYRQIFRLGWEDMSIKKGLFYAISISTVCFIWVAYISPVAKLHMTGILYDIKAKAPNESLIRTDLSFFEGYAKTSNYHQLGEILDSLNSNTSDINEENNHQFKQTNSKLIAKLQIERAKMLAFPVMTFILFFSGMFLGVLGRKNRLVLLLAGIYFTIFPGIYYLSIYFEKAPLQSRLTPFQGQLFHVLILAALTFLLWVYAKRQLYSLNK